MEMPVVIMALEQLRQKTGLSDERFAARAGVSVSTYSRQKNGKQVLGGETLRAYARIAKQENDAELLATLAAFAVGLEPEQVQVNI